MSQFEHDSNPPMDSESQGLSLRNRAILFGGSLAATLAIATPGLAHDRTDRATIPAPEGLGNVPERTDTSSMTDDTLEDYCLTDALYSYASGSLRYKKPNKAGRYINTVQKVEGRQVDPACDDVVDREVGSQQFMTNKRGKYVANTDYTVFSNDNEAFDRRKIVKGDRQWKCYKSFFQRIYVTATLADGSGKQKKFTSPSTKPNCI